MFPYGVTQREDTPGPETTVEVRPLRDPATGLKIVAIADSGAVQSCLPAHVVLSLDEQHRAIRKPIRVRSAMGDVVQAEAARLRVFLGEVDLGEHWFVVATKGYGLLGRDILNGCHVVLDGPNRRWQIELR